MNKIFLLLYIQGIFYFLMGVWPVIDIFSFMVVTGPKTDLWLVKTVGLMIFCTSAVLIYGAVKKEFSFSVLILAILNALVLMGVDIYYSLTGVISKIYLADAAVEALLIMAWLGVSSGATIKAYDTSAPTKNIKAE